MLKSRIHRLANVELVERSDDMSPIYASTRVLLVPSQWEAETWGRVVSEAQFSGIPVLASDRGALPETVGAGGAIIKYDAPVYLGHRVEADVVRRSVLPAAAAGSAGAFAPPGARLQAADRRVSGSYQEDCCITASALLPRSDIVDIHEARARRIVDGPSGAKPEVDQHVHRLMMFGRRRYAPHLTAVEIKSRPFAVDLYTIGVEVCVEGVRRHCDERVRRARFFRLLAIPHVNRGGVTRGHMAVVLDHVDLGV